MPLYHAVGPNPLWDFFSQDSINFANFIYREVFSFSVIFRNHTGGGQLNNIISNNKRIHQVIEMMISMA